MRRALPIFLALGLLGSACSGPLFGGRSDTPETSSQRERLPPAEELLALQIDTIPMTADGAQSLRQLSEAITRGREEDRRRLRRHRGNLLADFIVAARAWQMVDPAKSEWFTAAAGVLVATDAASPDFGDRVIETVTRDLGEAGAGTVELVEATLAGAPAPPTTGDQRHLVIQLADLSQGFAAWSRYGDAADGGAYGDLAVGPNVAVAAGLNQYGLQSETNSRQVAVLRAVNSSAVAVQALDTPLSRAVAGVSSDLRARVAAAAVPLELSAQFILEDPQLVPPRSFMSLEPATGGLGFTFRRILVIRTTGVRAVLQPHAAIADGALYVPGAEDGWLVPGRDVLEFDRPGAIPPDAIVDDSAPSVEDAFAELELLLADAEWMPIEERRGVGVSVGVSVISDGDTYYATMRPLLRALWNMDYGPIALHTLNEETGALDAVAVRLVEGVAMLDNVVTVREDGYLVTGYDPENLRTPTTVSRIAPGALVSLHNAIIEGFESGVLDPDQPLTVQVDDNSIDYGVLAHMLAAISFRRDLDGVTTDLELLRAPVVFEDEMPQVLAPRGLRLAL